MPRETTQKNGELFVFSVVSSIVIASRLPFLLPGYGTDPDGWGVAWVARQIAAGSGYLPSRFPGYPVQELVSSLIWKGGPLALNGATAILSGLAAAFLALSMKTLGHQRPVLASLAFAFVPVVFINSANAMDYMWAIAFILGSLYFLLGNRLLISAILLGLAVGCRITSAAMVVPLGILLFMRRRSLAALAGWMALAAVVGAIAFLPGLLKYGLALFELKHLGTIPWTKVVPMATTSVWGALGLGALGFGVAWSALRLIRCRGSSPPSPYGWRGLVWALPILLYSIAFMLHPHDSGYLIPVVPFTILILSEIGEQKGFEFACVGLLCSSFLLGVHLGPPTYFPAPQNSVLNFSVPVDLFRWRVYVAPFQGPILFDHSVRTYEVNRFQDIISMESKRNARAVVVTGWELPKFAVLAPEPRGSVEYVWLLDGQQAERYRNDGFQILFLPEMLQPNEDVYGINLREFGAVPVGLGSHP